MEVVEPSKLAYLCDSFCAAPNNITEGISDSQAAATAGCWTKWAKFCQGVALNPLRVLYQDLVLILNTFVRQYRIGAIAPRRHQVQYRTVQDAVRLIFQVLTAMGSPYPHLITQGELNICL